MLYSLDNAIKMRGMTTTGLQEHLMMPVINQLKTINKSANPQNTFPQKDHTKSVKEEIKKRMERRYVKYFKHWKDYEMLTCILAMIGLILALVEVTTIYNIYSTSRHLTISTETQRK